MAEYRSGGLPRAFDIVTVSLPGSWDPAIPIAASRAGATGILDLSGLTDRSAAELALSRLLQLGVPARCGALVDLDEAEVAEAALDALPPEAPLWVFSGPPERLKAFFAAARERGLRIGLVVTSSRELPLLDLGPDVVVAKGHESGGRIGEETAFVLTQAALAQAKVPVLAWGGMGWHTAPACRVAGTAGVVLDWQLAMLRESTVPPVIRQHIARMDGSETAVVRGAGEARYRLLVEPGLAALEALEGVADLRAAWRQGLTRPRVRDRIWPVGQDACFAPSFAKRGRTVGQALAVFRDHVDAAVERILASDAMRAGSAMAASQGTQYPVMQGPMTRVSDVPGFLDAVERAGALPMLAPALLRGAQLKPLMEQTRERMGSRSWGVGILGFVDAALRAEQMEIIRTIRPPFAVIAGGRPGQAAEMEAMGIRTYLHVPSPAILESFLGEGARRFIFEGMECGGHVGPRSSFVLWESMVRLLLDADLAPPAFEDLHVYFAGGIHDATSSLIASAIAQALIDRGAKFGVEMGTAYLFTREAVSTGAIVPTFQAMALSAEETVLFESGPGHAIRCVRNACYDDFQSERARLREERLAAPEMRERLESRHLGRLRLASKGILRDADTYVPVPEDQQQREGMYMIGQVAAMHRQVGTIAELHGRVCDDVHERIVALRGRVAPVRAAAAPEAPAALDVAIVGIGCLLPGAEDPATFWQNILSKKDLIQEVPADRFNVATWFDADPRARDKINSRWGGFVQDVLLDPLKYGIPPASIPSIEPAQLLALELVDRALRDTGTGGLDPGARSADRTSVILGVGGGMADLGAQYAMRALVPRYIADADESLMAQLPEWTEDSFAGILLNVVAGRVANRFDFGGVNFTVDAACASSLAAIYLACRELAAGTSDRVVAGGCDTIQGPFAYLCFAKAGALSPGGKPRVFDENADGIAISEGLAAVVLKRREDAERDGDRIYAVLRAVAGGSDGRSKSMTAPHVDGQRRTLERAYAQARIRPTSVSLFEAHGTGTALGDRTECTALTELLRAGGSAPRAHALGSVKSMIGHTKCTAGVAGLIKAALALHHRVLPPTLNVETPNGAGGLAGGPLYVNTEARPWIGGDEPRRAGVSAFGFGGTNFHAVLEEYAGDPLGARRRSGRTERSAELFFFSAGSREVLPKRMRLIGERLREALAAGARPRLADLAYTHHVRRHVPGQDQHRVALVARSVDEFRSQLEGAIRFLESEGAEVPLPAGVSYGHGAVEGKGPLAFLFPGQGSQIPNMMRELALEFAEVNDTLSEADACLRGRYPYPLSHYVFPPPSFSLEEAAQARKDLATTTITQPALGACSVAMMRLLEAFALRPEAAAGHSYGELTALHAAGAIGFRDLLELSYRRGEAMVAGGAGGDLGTMLAVAADGAVVAEAIEGLDDVWVANANSPSQTVISGSTAAMDRAAERLGRRDVPVTSIPVQCAFHTPLMVPARDRFAAALAAFSPGPLRFPVFGNATATAYPADPQAIPERLLDQLVKPVRFVEELEAMYAAGVRAFVEVGPNQVLTRLVGETLAGRPHLAVHTGSRGAGGLADLLHALAELAVAGHAVCFDRLYEGRDCALIDLPALAAKPQEVPAPHLWLVNSAYARRAHEPKRVPKPLARMRQPAPEPPAVPPPAPIARPAAIAPVPVPRPVPVPPPAPIASSRPARAPEVFLRAQETMRKFLESQEAILRAYFGDAPAAAAPAREVVAAPMRLPEPVPAPPKVAPAPIPVAVAAPSPHGTLIDIVANRTGYPSDMLDLGADLEADLGIDSIKRVEIIAAFRRAVLPEMKEPTRAFMDAMTEARSLRAILDAVEPFLGAATPVLTPAPPAQPTPAPVAIDAGAELVRVVAERTGYPPDMLDLDADLEADLGIDSIKRVEIIAAFRRAVLPEMKEPTRAFVDAMTEARSLRAVLQAVRPFVGAPAVAALAPQPAPPEVDASVELVRVVAERTGYPPDMLDLDADLEADLGIDSIKRVEIIAAFRRAVLPEMKEPTRAFVDAMTEARSLRGILRAAEPFLGTPQAPVAVDASAELVRVVAERTGYPPDMLDLDADLEADLGIDSIKRVEIVAAFRRAVLPDMTEPSRAFVDSVASARTMRAMLQALVRFLEPSFEPAPAKVARTPRCVVRTVELPAECGLATLPENGVVLVTDDGCGASASVRQQLLERGAKVVVVPTSSLEKRETVTAAVEAARREGRIVGAVHLAPAADLPVLVTWVRDEWLQAERTELQALLFLAQALAPELGASVDGSFLFAAVTSGGGDFGPLSVVDDTAPWRGGIAGFMKCAALEWPGARIRALDLDDVPDDEICDLLLREWSETGPVEVGYRDRRRIGLQAVEAPLNGLATEPHVRLDEKSVVLVTGGARGITAEVVKELAERSRSTFVLVARTPLPEGPGSEEPPELASARTAKDLRTVVANALRAQQRRVSPKDVEARVQSVLRAREVRETLAAIRAAGAKVEYIPCDVSDGAAFGAVVADVAARHGRIDALIHGAGAIEDKLIVDKTEDSFQRVLRTKVDPLLTLIATVPRGSIKLVIVFSSVAGFFGNRGQADYAAANEVLNRLAELIRRHWGIKVMSLNWGPWEGTGMVTEEVAEQFKSKGIDLVTIDQGRRAVWDEICQPAGSDVRILLGPGPWIRMAQAAAGEEAARLSPVALPRTGPLSTPAPPPASA